MYQIFCIFYILTRFEILSYRLVCRKSVPKVKGTLFLQIFRKKSFEKDPKIFACLPLDEIKQQIMQKLSKFA